MQEFCLFIDDSGNPKLNSNSPSLYFAMGGVLAKREDGDKIAYNVEQFKIRWNIPLDVPLHGNEVRSMKSNFAWLEQLEQPNLLRFHEELTELITGCPITVHACVISRSGYLKRYLECYGDNTWEMMKTAFSIVVERTAKFVARQDGKMMVCYERMGRKEDRRIESYFHALRNDGHPFSNETASKYAPLSSNEFSKLLSGIEGKTKQRLELQIADLCLYPVARIMDQPENRAYHAMHEKRLLVDCHLLPEERKEMGIKYFCFDN